MRSTLVLILLALCSCASSWRDNVRRGLVAAQAAHHAALEASKAPCAEAQRQCNDFGGAPCTTLTKCIRLWKGLEALGVAVEQVDTAINEVP